MKIVLLIKSYKYTFFSNINQENVKFKVEAGYRGIGYMGMWYMGIEYRGKVKRLMK